MANTINRVRLSILKEALKEYTNTFNRVHIYGVDGGFRSPDAPMTWTVGWASIGDVTPAEAVEFAEKIKAASRIAEELNKMEMKVVWENDAQLAEILANEGKEEARKKCDKLAWAVNCFAEIDDWGCVADLLLNKEGC